jgi:uncharacterized protein
LQTFIKGGFVMNPLKDYIIHFSGLADGKSSFEYIVDKAFFNAFEYSEITEGEIKIELILDKQITMMVLEFVISGHVTCFCDRCLENYQQEIAGNERIIVKFSENKSEETDEIKIVSSSENQIDISQDVYEFINLMLPVKRVHPDDDKGNNTCDPEMIRKLEKLSVKENNDPRWDELKKLSFKN